MNEDEYRDACKLKDDDRFRTITTALSILTEASERRYCLLRWKLAVLGMIIAVILGIVISISFRLADIKATLDRIERRGGATP